MLIIQVSNSLNVIENITPDELRSRQKKARYEFVQVCQESSDVRVPSTEDLNHWWPLTSMSDA